MTKIIGVSGRAGAGKDTLAELLAQETDEVVQIDWFAEPLRQMLVAGLGLAREDFAPGRKEQVIPWIGKSPRQLLQTLGTEWGREQVRRDIWVRAAERRTQESGADVVIFADVRFDDEAEWIRANGVLIHLSRPLAHEVAQHRSESGIAHEQQDIALYNAGSIDDLRHVACAVAARVGLGEAE